MTKRCRLAVVTLMAAAGCALTAHPGVAQGPYPSRTVKIIIPSAPGSTTDTLARLVADQLSQKWGKTTIVENIAGGALLTEEDAWNAAHAAGLAEEIAAMPMGLHTFVSEGGSNLSGGQRQRLLIARALVRQPAIILFDEATSALDNRTQALVTASLERLQSTRVVIAHRLSTIRQADRIYVIVGGCVVQEGTFADLARQEGLFVQLMAHQGG